MIAIWAWVIFLGIILIVVVVAVLRSGARADNWANIRADNWDLPPPPTPSPPPRAPRPVMEQRPLENQPRLLSSLVMTADRVAAQVMLARGYPLNEIEQGEYAAPDGIAEHHARIVVSYHDAHQIAVEYRRGRGDVEDLRRARREFRVLFGELLQDGSKWPRPAEDEMSRRAGR